MITIDETIGKKKLNYYRHPIKKELWRVYETKYGFNESIYFAKDSDDNPIKSGRFGDPDRNEGVCYFGWDFKAAIVEKLLQKNRTFNGVSYNELLKYSMVKVSFDKTLKLVKLHGNGLHRNQVDVLISKGEHSISKQYSGLVINNPNRYDGLYHL